jgi:plastocyanin
MASPPPIVTVAMTAQLRFEPEHLVIKVGETVRWDNVGNMPHTATDDPEQNPVARSHPEYALLPSGAEPWGSPLLQPGESFEHTFTVAGDYRYFCIPHVLSGMRGTITVEC